MASLSQVQIKMNDGSIYYVPMTEFNLGGIGEQPQQVIGGYIHGSRPLMLYVNTLANMTGTWEYVNPKLIISMTPTWS